MTGNSNYTGAKTAGGGFGAYAAGNKSYGGGRPMPTVGPVDPMGYKERDAQKAKIKTKNNAILARLKAMQGQNYMSAAYLGTEDGMGTS